MRWHLLKVTEIVSSRGWVKSEIYPFQPSAYSFQLHSYSDVAGPQKKNAAKKYNCWHWSLLRGSVALQKRKGLLYNY